MKLLLSFSFKIEIDHPNIRANAFDRILKMNLLYLGILFTGEVFRFMAFCARYPYVLWNMMLFAATSAIGQVRLFTSFMLED